MESAILSFGIMTFAGPILPIMKFSWIYSTMMSIISFLLAEYWQIYDGKLCS